ncbi:unnamed protein product [Trifolium pratense]|uniref:Uncharacterized protein n=1 Tax=Trifolium pratense TaxID=57577 RepID=A0ACB0IRD5_TRIPR|nr:unnamed protein product [Trifolium pratense]
MMKKAEVVIIPSPGVGHLVSTLEFAKLLINRNNHLRITILVIKLPHTTETDIYTKSLSNSNSLNIINLPECSLPTNSNLGSAMNAILEAQKQNVKQAVADLITEREDGVLAAFVVDLLTCSALTLLMLLENSPSLPQLLQLTEVTIPSFANSVPTKSLPSSVLHKEYESFFMSYAKGLKNADGIIVNSFEELESYAIRSFCSHPGQAGLLIYPVGPILNPEPKTKGVVDSADIIKWLDDQPRSLVVFLCFGSRGYLDEEQVNEIALAIENSGAHFVWSLRKPPPIGTMVEPSNYTLSDLGLVLPVGFLDRTAKTGRVIGWAPQAQILAHQATSGFVSHCGWNSILESIYFGVPVATWPLFADQQTNAFQLVGELKIAVEIALDYNVHLNGERNYFLTADKIERGIRNVLEKDGEVW